jgi:hypothetical protein
VTFEARLVFILAFFVIWSIAALIPWAAAAVISRGRGAAWALPVCVAAGCAFGVAVPVLGARDFTGFIASIFAALVGSALAAVGTIALARRLQPDELEARPGIEVGSTRRRRVG